MEEGGAIGGCPGLLCDRVLEATDCLCCCCGWDDWGDECMMEAESDVRGKESDGVDGGGAGVVVSGGVSDEGTDDVSSSGDGSAAVNGGGSAVNGGSGGSMKFRPAG